MHEIIFGERGTRCGENAVITMPYGDASRNPRHELGPQVVAVKSVITHQHDVRIRRCEGDDPSEHEVMQAVGAVHHLGVEIEVTLRHAGKAGRMIGHEVMRDLIDGAEIHGGEIPLRVLQRPARRGLHGESLRQMDSQVIEPVILPGIHLRVARTEQADRAAIDVLRAHAQVVHQLRILLRPDGAARRGRPVLSRAGGGRGKKVRDHAAAGYSLPVSGEPAQHMAFQILRGEHIPKRGALAGGGGDRLHALGQGIHLGEAEHTVIIRPPAGGDAGPEHRREHRLKRAQVSRYTALHDAPQHRHLATIHERRDDFPVRAVPADEEEFRFLHGFSFFS